MLGFIPEKARHRLSMLPVYTVLILLLLVAAFPFAITIFTAFKDNSEIVKGALALPKTWRWGNFQEAWSQAHFNNYFRSSVIVVLPVMGVAALLSIMTGYAFGRLRFPFSRVIFVVFLLGIMVPQESYIIPLYYELRELGLLDTYWALILPQIGMSVCFGTFWMRGFFSAVPRDLADAAKVDGCTSWGVLWRVLLPVVWPGVLTMLVLFFIWTWNDFLLALVLVTKEELRTLPLGLAFFQGRHTTNIPLISAGATMVSLPSILIYVVFQRYFIKGIVGGSVK
jgi:raffinose/stachyose/melibiose transport system permease protein